MTLKLNSLVVRALFLVVPLLLFGLSRKVHNASGDFSITYIDPEYLHLYNGIAIADGQLDVGYTAHPGTPLQYVIAVAARIHFAFADASSFVDHFIDHPQEYITSANVLLNLILSVCLFYLGLLTFRYSGSIAIALAVQLCVFGHYAIVFLTGRLFPEGLMLIPLLVVILLVIRNIYTNPRITRKELLFFALPIGFGIACKLTFAPLLFIPLILLRTNIRQKVELVTYSLVAFLLFAYPVVLHFHDFYEWTGGMAVHSGKYGGGSKGFIDLEQAALNLKELFTFDPRFFFVTLCACGIAIVSSFVPSSALNVTSGRIRRAILAVSAALFVAVLLTIKHFALHYFTPFYCFNVLLIVLAGILLIRTGRNAMFTARRMWIPFAMTLPLVLFGCKQTLEALFYQQNITTEKTVAAMEVNAMITAQIPIVILAPYSGSPFVAYAHMNGLKMSYNAKSRFKDRLIERFPMSYHYVQWSPDLYFFEEERSWKEVAAQGIGRFYLYVGNEVSPGLDEVKARMSAAFGVYSINQLRITEQGVLWLVKLEQ